MGMKRQQLINLLGCIIGFVVWLLMLYYAAWAASLAP